MWLHNQPPPHHLFYPRPGVRGQWVSKMGFFFAERAEEGGIALTAATLHVNLQIDWGKLTRLAVIAQKLIPLSDVLERFEEGEDKQGSQRLWDAAEVTLSLGEGYIQPFPEDSTEHIVAFWGHEDDCTATELDVTLGADCAKPILNALSSLPGFRHYLAVPWIIKMRPNDITIPLYDPWYKRRTARQDNGA